MKTKTIFLLSICLCTIIGCKKDNILKLPITYHQGFGPLQSSGGGSITLYNDDEINPWKKTFLEVSGIPENWTNAKVGDINSDIYQYVYQNYHSDHISKQWYNDLKQMWNWEPDTLNLSKKPLKCRAAFAIGIDSLGNDMVVVDSNNNYDFSDDKPFIPIEYNSNLDWDSLAKNEAINVTFERQLKNAKTEFEVPIIITTLNQDYYLYCNFAQYGTAKLENQLIFIQSGGFNDSSYKNAGITIDQGLNGEKIDSQNLVYNNEYLEIGNDLYKNLGVNRNKDFLLLEKVDLSKNQIDKNLGVKKGKDFPPSGKTDSTKNQIQSSQIGFKALDFSGIQFKKQNTISLASLEGKYVLLDFWATWCGPCIHEIPNLKTLYDKTDKSKFEIIGIVGDSPLSSLEQLTNKYGINWPQIVSDNSNKIKEKYGIVAYPTTFLINPEGKIIAKNLRGKELETKIDSLMNKASR
tara:strand:- start:134 stop:1525 length:1392 start_codon:yes stop_codon:yes gene_type:complete